MRGNHYAAEDYRAKVEEIFARFDLDIDSIDLIKGYSTDDNVLSQVAGIYRNGGKSIQVVGHASQSTGVSDQVRQDLVNYKASLDRATSAAAALLRIGIPQDRIEIAAVGAREPRYTEESAAGVAGNQRVEVFIQY